MKNPSTVTGRRTHRRIKLSTIAALGALGLSIDASAQGVADSPIDAIDGIESYEILPDDTLLITLENGETLTLNADAYVVIGEQIFLRENGAALVQAAIESGIGSATLLAAAAGLGAFRLASELGEDDGSPPSDTDTTSPIFTSDNSASMAENVDTATVVYDANATDNATLTYSLSGIDAALFEIDSATGEVRFLAAPDFEAPGDEDGDGVFEITITASDGTNTSSLDVAITLTDTNDEAPVFTSADSVDSVSEAATDTVYTATVTDADSAASEITFSLAEGGDNAHFSIDASTGEVTLNDSVDFDAPLDSDGDNVYNIQIIASDGTNETTHDVAITITDAGDEDPVFTSSAAANVNEGETGTGIIPAATADLDGEGVHFEITGGADGQLFRIHEITGELEFISAPDHEAPGDGGDAAGDNVYEVELTGTDESGNTSVQTILITVNDVADEDPVFTSGTTVSVDENQTDTGYTAQATPDVDGAQVTYSIAGGLHADWFEIDPDTGELSFKSAPDHESQVDGFAFFAAASASETGWAIFAGTSAGLLADADGDGVLRQGDQITINGGPPGNDYFAGTIQIDGHAVLVLVRNANGDIAGTNDVSLIFPSEVDPNDTTLPDLNEIAAMLSTEPYVIQIDNSFEVDITATDEDGNASTQTVIVTVNDIADEGPVFTSGATASVNENETDTGYVPAATPDLDGSAVTYTITGGADAALFELNAAGELVFLSAPDHENPSDQADAASGATAGDNVYEVEITATDEDGNQTAQTVSVTVGDIGDENPVFTSATTASMNEGETATGYTAQAAPDVDSETVTYSIVGGAHGDLFDIDPDTGELVFKSAPDFEAPVPGQSTSGFVEYQNGVLVGTGATVGAGMISEDPASSNGDGVLSVGEGILLDGEQSTHEYWGPFSIGGETLIVTQSGDSLFFWIPAGVAPDSLTFPTNAPIFSIGFSDYSLNANDAYQVEIEATDESGNTTTQIVTITVNDVDGEPVFSNTVTQVSVDEGTGASAVLFDANATDPNGSDPSTDDAGITYSLTGVDAAAFDIDADTGEVTFKSTLPAPDHENPADTGADNTYDIGIVATDVDGNSHTMNVEISVDDIADEDPVFTSATTASVDENQTDTGYTAQATPDVDGQKITYSIVGGDHYDLFDIDPDTGELSFKSAPDYDATPGFKAEAFVQYESRTSTPIWQEYGTLIFEDPGDSGLTDGVFTPGEAESGGSVYLGTVTIKGHKVLVFVDYGGSDGSGALFFYIPPGTDLEQSDFPDDRSELTIVAEDFQLEQLSDYQVEIEARDESGNYSIQAVIISVNDVEEAPIFSNTETDITIDEGTSRLVTLFDADATDPNGTNPSVADDGITYSLTGDDASQFDVDADTGELTFAVGAYARDHDNPADTGGDNTYNVTLVARDAEGETTTLDLTINLRDLRDEDPVFTSSETASIDENTTQTGITPQATPDFASDTVTYSIVGGAHADLFEIDQTTGELVFKDAPDYEAAPAQFRVGSVASYIVGSQSTPSVSATQTYVLTDADGVLEVGDPITRDGTSSSSAYYAGTVIIDGHTMIVTTSSPAGDVNDNAFVTIWAPEGVSVTFPDFSALTISTDPYTLDTSNQYQVIIEADDGTNNNFQTVTITVDDVDENAPVFSNTETAVSVNENTSTSSVVFDANATDPDGTNPSTDDAGITYTLSGDDAALFDIDADTGEVTFKTAPDHENPADTGGDNTYDITITAKDAADRTTDLDVQITVDDVSETDPVFTSATTASIAENQTTSVYTVQATPDVQGTEMTYYLIDSGPHYDLFEIDQNTGEIKFINPPDFDSAPFEFRAAVNISYRDGQLLPFWRNDNSNFISEKPTSDPGSVDNVLQPGEPILRDGSDQGDVYLGTILINGYKVLVTEFASSGGTTTQFWIPPGTDLTLNDFSTQLSDFSIVAEDFQLAQINEYEIEVAAYDGSNNSYQQVLISVTDTADDDPVFTSGTTASVAENETDTGYIPAATPDLDGSAVTYTITGGADAALFELNASGELVFKAAPDHENPSDQADAASGATAGDNVYEVEITATDEDGNQTAQTVSVTVGDTGDDAPGLAATASVSVQEGVTATDYQVGATPDVSGAAITYAITGGEDKDLFAISAAGVVTFKSAPTYNDGGDYTYQIVVTASEANGQSATQTITFTVTEDTGGAQPPTFTNSETTASVNENISTSTVVYDANATDPDGDDSNLTYSLSSSGDYEDFDIDADTGEITFKASPDHEAPDDSDGDNDYDLTIVVTDETNQTSSTNVTISVDDVADDAPVLTSATSININENPSGVIYTAQATPDVAGAKITYSLASGVSDSDAFTIDANTGELTFITPPDHENPHDGDTTNSYGAQIIAAEEGGRSVSTRVIFFVKDVGDEAPAFTSSTSFSITEGDTATGYQAAADPDVSNAAITYAITGGEDKDLFAISAAGVVTFKSAPTYNDGGDNTYQIVVTASEANGQSATQTITFTVTEDTTGALPPSFTNSETTASVNENISTTTVVYDANATDPDGDDNNLTYRLATTRDNNDLRIDPDTGEITFRTSPDYDTPADFNLDNVYDLTVFVTDEAGNTTSQSVTITVNNLPVEFTSGTSASVNENTSAVVYTAAATPDDAGAQVKYSLGTGGDNQWFSIDADTGEVTFVNPPDYETPNDVGGDNTYNIEIIATDQTSGEFATHQVAIQVQDLDDTAPVFTNTTTSVNVDENVSTSTVVFDANAIDPGGDASTLTYSLASGGDNNRFNINQNTGEVTFKTAPNHEAPTDVGGNNVYNITIYVTDEDNETDSLNVTITVGDTADTGPVFTSGTTASVSENQTDTGNIPAATPDLAGDVVTYTITGGADAALFELNASGELVFKSAPDHENPADVAGNAAGDNVYEVEITAEDEDSNQTTRTVFVTVDDIADDDPVFTSPSAFSIVEGNTATGYQAAADPDIDNAAVTYTITGGAHASLFSISATGVVTFIDPPDYNDGGNNTYDVEITATEENGQSATQSVSITVTEFEPAEIISLDSLTSDIGFKVQGAPNVTAAESLSSAGDINSDGYDDVLIGAWHADTNGTNSGQTTILFGGPNMSNANVNSLAPEDGFTLVGSSGENFGYAVSNAGDLNGDGYDDFIIGTPSANTNGRDSGIVHVVYGGADFTSLNLDTLQADGYGFAITQSYQDYRLGLDVTSIGDIDGDGLDDLAVTKDNGVDNIVTIIFGSETPTDINIDSMSPDQGFSLARDPSATRSADLVISSAGDVNGDGYEDFIVGDDKANDSSGSTPSGAVYIIYGGEGLQDFNLADLSAESGILITSSSAGAWLGAKVAAAGDVNGDGYDDLMLASSRGSETIVIFGGQDAAQIDLSAPLDPQYGFRISNASYAFSSAGDVNGDGYDDMIVSDVTLSNDGHIYVIYGRPNLTDIDVQSLSSAHGFEIFGSNAAGVEYIGHVVSSAGDVNGDGFDDVMVGGRTDATDGANSTFGGTYIIYGGNTGTEDTTSVSRFGTSAADNFTGNAGDDTFYEISTGDVVRGGAGDDHVTIDTVDFADLDGGHGYDTLSVDVSGLTLDIRAPQTSVKSFEKIDLGSNGVLILDKLSIQRLSDDTSNGVTKLVVDGGSASTVQFDDEGWTHSGTISIGAFDYNVYQNGNAIVYVQTGTQTAFPVVATASPVITSGDTVGVSENTATSSVVYDASATDTDSAQSDLKYSLSGTDADDFNINADTGEVTFKVAPDHENPDDNDGDNVYDFTVTATDDTNNSTSKDVTLTVNDIVDEDPVFTSLSAASVNEGETATGLTVSADPDLASDAVTYSITGGAHADLFTIDADTGDLSFVSAPDYEAPVSAYAYDSIVTYSTADQTTVVVQNPDGTRVITEDPSSSSGTVNGTLEVSEAFLIDGAAGGIYRGYLTVGGQDLIVSSYDDAGTTYFTIYVPSGMTAEDLGVPSSLPASAHRISTLDLPEINDYQVEVQASDGTRTSTQMITISVLDVDESAALLSGNSLSTVKLSVDSFDSVEGEIVSSPTDPEDLLDPISTVPAPETFSDYDWSDDGFAAMQMQLDMSDALDGL